MALVGDIYVDGTKPKYCERCGQALDWGERMKPQYILPLILIAFDIGAAVVYFLNHDYKKCVYWIAAAVLNVAVTF